MSERKTCGGKVERCHDVFLKSMPHIFSLSHGRAVQKLSCLDIGCGAGVPLIWFREILKEHQISLDLFGVDKGQYLEEAQERGIHFHKLDLDFHDLPFPKECFHIVLTSMVIEHTLNPEHVLEEAHRVLKTDGLLILITPNLRWWVNLLALMAGYNPYIPDTGSEMNYGMFTQIKPQGHIRAYTLHTLKILFSHCGFQILGISGTENADALQGRKVTRRVFVTIDRVIAKSFPSLACTIGIIASKVKARDCQSTDEKAVYSRKEAEI
nr:class I SAM-dependent methyltransferase [Candidatus Njordarchaeum guaymaensis]